MNKASESFCGIKAVNAKINFYGAFVLHRL